MFDIGWSELLVVVVVTILVVGPKELPGLLRTIGKTVGNMRRMAGDFQSQFNEALREAELDEVKNTIGDIKKLDPKNAIKDAVTKQIASVDDAGNDVAGQLEKTGQDLKDALEDISVDDASINDGADVKPASNSDVADLVEDVPHIDDTPSSGDGESATESEAAEDSDSSPSGDSGKKADA